MGESARGLRPQTPSRTSGPAPGGFAPWPPAGASPLHPTPFSLLRQRKGGNRAAAPHCARPSPAARGSPRCSQAGPGQNSRRSLRSLCSNRLAESEGSRACGTRAGVLCSSAAQRGWNSQIPNSQPSSRCRQSTARGSAVGCWLLAVARRLRRRGAQTGGPCAAGAHRDLTRAACLSGGSEASAASSARGPLVEHHREPAWPQAERASAVGPPFFSPLFFGGAKKRGSGVQGAEGPLRAAPQKYKEAT
jgi:hypothetical protein